MKKRWTLNEREKFLLKRTADRERKEILVATEMTQDGTIRECWKLKPKKRRIVK